MNNREGLLKVILDGYVTLFGVFEYNSDNFTKYFGNVDICLVERLLFKECSNVLHRLVSCTGISNYPFDRRSSFDHI